MYCLEIVSYVSASEMSENMTSEGVEGKKKILSD